MSPRRTRRGTIRESVIEASIDNSLKNTSNITKRSRRTNKSHAKASEDDSDSLMEVHSSIETVIPPNILNETSTKAKKRKRGGPEASVSQDSSLSVTIEEPKRKNAKTPRNKKQTTSSRTRAKESQALLSEEESFNKKSVKQVSYSLISENEDQAEVPSRKKTKSSKKESKTSEQLLERISLSNMSIDNNVTPKTSPNLNVSFTPHRSKKTPKKSPISLGSPKTHSPNPVKFLIAPKRLSIVDSPPSSENSLPQNNSLNASKRSTPKNSKSSKSKLNVSSSKKKSTISFKPTFSKSPKIVLKTPKTKSKKLSPLKQKTSPVKSDKKSKSRRTTKSESTSVSANTSELINFDETITITPAKLLEKSANSSVKSSTKQPKATTPDHSKLDLLSSSFTSIPKVVLSSVSPKTDKSPKKTPRLRHQTVCKSKIPPRNFQGTPDNALVQKSPTKISQQISPTKSKSNSSKARKSMSKSENHSFNTSQELSEVPLPIKIESAEITLDLNSKSLPKPASLKKPKKSLSPSKSKKSLSPSKSKKLLSPSKSKKSLSPLKSKKSLSPSKSKKSLSPSKSKKSLSPSKSKKSLSPSKSKISLSPSKSKKSPIKSVRSLLNASSNKTPNASLPLSSKKMPKIVLTTKKKSPLKSSKSVTPSSTRKSVKVSPARKMSKIVVKSPKITPVSKANKVQVKQQSRKSSPTKDISKNTTMSPKVVVNKLSSPSLKNDSLTAKENQPSVALVPVDHASRGSLDGNPQSPISVTTKKSISPVKSIKSTKSMARRSISASTNSMTITPSGALANKFLGLKPKNTSTPREKARPIRSPLGKSKIIKRLNNRPMIQSKQPFLDDESEPSFDNSSLIRMSDVFDVDTPRKNNTFDKNSSKTKSAKAIQELNKSDTFEVDKSSQNSSRRGKKNDTFEVTKASPNSSAKDQDKKNDTYEVNEPKTPGFQSKSIKRTVKEAELDDPHEKPSCKRSRKVNFTSPARENIRASSINRIGTPGHPMHPRKTPTSVNKTRTPLTSTARSRISLLGLKTPMSISLNKAKSNSVVDPNKSRRSNHDAQVASVNRLSRPKTVIDSQKKLETKTPVKRKIPNFAEIHQKNFAKMESLVDLKKRVEKRHVILNAGSAKKAATDPSNGAYNRFGFKVRKNDAVNLISKKQTSSADSRQQKRENARSALQGVRMNRRFELQMKARIKTS